MDKPKLAFEEIHGSKFDISVKWPSTLENATYIVVRNFDTLTPYVWNTDGWWESSNDLFIEVGGRTGEIYDNFTLDEARAVRPEAFR